MPIVPADWSVTRSNGNIRYIGDAHAGASPSYATVKELHVWTQGLADDETSVGDDEIAIVDLNPTDKSTDNIIKLLGNYNIDFVTSQHLYDGSIIQGTGGTEVFYDGLVNFGNAATIQVIQNGTVITDDWWNIGGGGLNADLANGISHRFMIKVRDAGADIDGRRLLGTARTFGNTYAEFPINGTSRGNNVLALSEATDLNNQTVIGTVAGWTSITNLEGLRQIDVDNNGATEDYYSEWNRGVQTINDLYERIKWLSRDGSASTLYGLSGELFRGITHELDIDTPTGTFSAVEAVSWPNGSGQMLALDSTTAGTKMWIQLLTGIVPANNELITGGSSGATCLVNVTVTSRSISTPFLGASTGSAIIGSFGAGIESADLSASDKLTDLSGTLVTPPNNVTFSVGGLVIGEDRVLVGPWNGSTTDVEGNPAIDKAQFTLQTSLSTVAETAIVVTTTIPVDTPSSGTVRIELNSGNERRVPYTSWSGSTFTIASTDFSTDPSTNPKNVWVSYIDKTATATTESFTFVYNADRSLVIRVRDGDVTPIKEFISSGVIGSGGGSVTAIRTSDA